MRPAGTRRLYAIDPEPLESAAAWFDPFRRFWQPHLDALGTELARGRRARRLAAEDEREKDASPAVAAAPSDPQQPEEN